MDDDMLRPRAELRRIDFTGTIWFGAGAVAAAVPFAALAASGWRPGQLPVVLAVIWWVGAAVTALGLGSLAWSGCPVFESDVATTDRNKAWTIRVGVCCFGVGMTATALAVLLAPV